MNLFARIVYRSIYLGCRLFKRKYVFLRPHEVDALVDSLTEKVANSGYALDVVISIMHGGAYPGQKIAKELAVPWNSISIQHYSLPVMGFNMVYLPGVVLLLRLFGHMKKPRLSELPDLDIEGKRVLLVDDDIEYGETMRLALEVLQTGKPADIRNAVLGPYNLQNHVDFCPSVSFDQSRRIISRRHQHGSRTRFKWPWEPLSPYYPMR